MNRSTNDLGVAEFKKIKREFNECFDSNEYHAIVEDPLDSSFENLSSRTLIKKNYFHRKIIFQKILKSGGFNDIFLHDEI